MSLERLHLSPSMFTVESLSALPCIAHCQTRLFLEAQDLRVFSIQISLSYCVNSLSEAYFELSLATCLLRVCEFKSFFDKEPENHGKCSIPAAKLVAMPLPYSGDL